MSTSRDDDRPAPPAPEPTFGRFLQSARLERSIRLDHVAEETRISLGTLEAIESEDVRPLAAGRVPQGLPASLRARGGADEHEAVARYHEWRRIQKPSPPPHTPGHSRGAEAVGSWSFCCSFWRG